MATTSTHGDGDDKPDGTDATDLQQGLSDQEADERLSRHGRNEIEEEESNPLLEFFSHFWGPIPWMLEAAVVLSLVAGKWEEFGVIFAMLLINGGISFWHEHQAENAIAALKEQLALKAVVVRGGEQKTIAARDVVPGDILILRRGKIVPADARLAGDTHLSVDESALTGESLPVDKEDGDECFSGTAVKRGEARARVTATGDETRFAKTVELVEQAEGGSHFRRAVMRIGYVLIAAAGLLVLTIVGVEAARGKEVLELLTFALVLLIAGIPAALPAVLTITMTVGAKRLAAKRAIVSRLAAIEEMAGMHVLCADKTGTLTKNELALEEPVVLAAQDADDLVLAAALTTRDDEEDPIDMAIREALDAPGVLDDYEITDFRPFDPTRKRAEADIRHHGAEFSVAKGAPQVILELVEADDSLRKDVNDKVEALAGDGFRALGVARKSDGPWQYLGLLSLLDPARDDSAQVVGEAAEHGIDIRMVTGDHVAIARQVARQLDLGTNIREAKELFADAGEGMDAHKENEVLEADGFAEVTPEHKFELVKYFQAGDRIVGMTGDGVNDAPALKQADVGIAVAVATDAARAAADLVLTAPGLGVIVYAVEESRRIFSRMVSYATYRIAETIRLLIFIAASILAFRFYPITPIMVVLLAILNDIPIMTIATDNAPTSARPVRWKMSRVVGIAAILGLTGVVTTFVLFWYLNTHTQLSKPEIQTVLFLKLLIAGHMTMYLTRSTTWFWRRPWPSLIFFVTLEATQVLGTLAAIFGILVHPISLEYVGLAWGYAVAAMFLIDAVKVTAYKFWRD